MRAAITAVSSYLPDYVLTNKELETMVDTSDEWIVSRSGIHERRIMKEPGKATAYMAAEAAKKLLQKRNIQASEIDVIILATVTPDYQFPASANIVSDMIGATNAWGFDLQAACSSFIYGLEVGSKLVESGVYKKVLLIGADTMSSIIDYTDRGTCILFGDGAGAVLLEATEENVGVMDARLYSDGAGRKYLYQIAGGSLKPASEESVKKREHFVKMDGQPVFKVAVVKMAEVAVEMMNRNHLKADDIAYLVPHQANKRIIEATADRMGVGMNKVMLNIQKYANTTSATLPLCLDEWEHQLKKGDNLILTTFGAGFTWGGIYIKWAYDSK